MKYLSKLIESYFSFIDYEKEISQVNTPNGRRFRLYDTSSIPRDLAARKPRLGLNDRITHYILISHLGKPAQLGIWFHQAYLVFNVLSVNSEKVLLDWKRPIVECDKGRNLIGSRD